MSRQAGLSITTIIHEDLYNAIHETLPHIREDGKYNDDSYLRFLLYLLLDAREDPSFGGPPAHEYVVARARQNFQAYKNGHLASRTFVEDFGAHVLKDYSFEITGYSPGDHCTVILDFDVPAKIWEAVEVHKKSTSIDQMVHAETGHKVRERHAREHRKGVKAFIASKQPSDVPEAVIGLRKYLNRRDPSFFTRRVNRNKKYIEEYVRRVLQEQSPEKVNQWRKYMRELDFNALPFYKHPENSVRLFPANQSLLTVPSEMRRLILDDCIELDMSAAQFGINAALWGVDDVRRRLQQESYNYWTGVIGHLARNFPFGYVSEEINQDSHEYGRIKKALKPNTYSLCFGMQESNLKQLGVPHSGNAWDKDYFERRELLKDRFCSSHIKDLGEAFLDYPVNRKLLEARDEQLQKIRHNGGATDCFGRWIAIDEDKGVDEKSVLAQLAQSVEIRLMLPLFAFIAAAEKAYTRPPLQIVLFQHDGLTIHVTKKDRRKRWIKTLIDVFRNGYHDSLNGTYIEIDGKRQIEEELDCGTIPTKLEIDYYPIGVDWEERMVA